MDRDVSGYNRAMDTTSAMEPGPAVGELASVPGPSPERVALVKANWPRTSVSDVSDAPPDEPTVTEQGVITMVGSYAQYKEFLERHRHLITPPDEPTVIEG